MFRRHAGQPRQPAQHGLPKGAKRLPKEPRAPNRLQGAPKCFQSVSKELPNRVPQGCQGPSEGFPKSFKNLQGAPKQLQTSSQRLQRALEEMQGILKGVHKASKASERKSKGPNKAPQWRQTPSQTACKIPKGLPSRARPSVFASGPPKNILEKASVLFWNLSDCFRDLWHPLGSPLGTSGDALEALLKPFARHEADIWLSFGSAEMAEMPPASPSPQRFQMEAKCLPHALLGASKELHSVS